MSKRVKNRKGKLGKDAKHNKQFAKEGSSSRTANNFTSGTGGGWPWWSLGFKRNILRVTRPVN